MRTEPVVLLALVQQNLQGADAKRQQSDADVIEFDAGSFEPAQVGRVFDEAKHQSQREHADRQIDEENPAPGIVEGDPPAQGRSDGGRHDGRDAIQRERQAAFLRRKRVRQNGLRHRLQPASARALHDAEEQKQPEARRHSAKQRTHGEDGETRS